MTSQDFQDEFAAWLDTPIQFAQLADPIPPEFRPERRVPLCLLLVEKSWGGKANWKSLHLLNWAMQSSGRIEMLKLLRGSQGLLERPIIRFEPALDRALDLAVGLGFLSRNANAAYALTPEGEDALQTLKLGNAFAVERASLAQIKGKVSGSEVDRILEWRTQ